MATRVAQGVALIHLDANYVVAALHRDSLVTHLRSSAAGDAVNISSVAWSEFLCGPIPPGDALRARALVDKVESLHEIDAQFAAKLFNESGRRLRSLPDCLIAAVAIRCGATLATMNITDFSRFESLGLMLL
jgi:predicted nucleic acid-binding protein